MSSFLPDGFYTVIMMNVLQWAIYIYMRYQLSLIFSRLSVLDWLILAFFYQKRIYFELNPILMFILTTKKSPISMPCGYFPILG